MKKRAVLLFSITSLLFTTSLYSQFELKINPIGSVLGSPDLTMEYNVADNVGIEAVVGTQFGNNYLGPFLNNFESRSGYNLRLVGKYYFSPNRSADEFYYGPFIDYINFKTVDNNSDPPSLRGIRKSSSAGFSCGYKWVSNTGLIIELGAGLGKTLFLDKFGFRFFNLQLFEDQGFTSYTKILLGYRF